MPKKKSVHPLLNEVMKRLKSDDEKKVQQATEVFERIGVSAAEMLLGDADNRRFSVKTRLRMLAAVEKIGVPLSLNNLARLESLMADKSSEVAVAARRILVKADPAGASALLAFSLLAGGPFGFHGRKKSSKRSLGFLNPPRVRRRK